ncbi:hypothetical protein EJ05DRAFT_304120 [Pseudovirgaria hyperparasitica]|uniref:Uncharacterized protein n=1 Tax=Pseudovirgaria hyperparasitica TaxID=470096 RepID=A0A6A6WDI6_9PEZI|nr:uncharacterized protein EJ05DRAFT_304120 [Pseudovirgaria hyperparasitica]KAF2759617.1 hypothetical protein EJ05DRAFT_304120 [Pseudovirgaria hyperparasitica]
MDEQVLKLGSLHLNCPRAGLQLCLALSITLFGSITADNPTNISQRALLAALRSQSVWVRRGQALHLLFDITVLGENQDINEARSFGQTLADSDLFRQLNLNASLCTDLQDSPRSEHSNRCLFRINVSHNREDADVEPSKLHHLLSGVLPTDLNPPKAIRMLELQCVRMEIVIISFLPSTEEESQSEDLEFVAPISMPTTRKSTTKEGLDTYDPCTSDQRNTCVKVATDKVSNISSSATTSGRSSIPSLGTSHSEQAYSDKQVNHTMASFKDGPPAIHRLLDVAVRRAISARLHKTAKGVNMKADNLTARLANVAPALFSPGYMRAVAIRACFVPTISQALSRSVLYNTQSPSLKTKLLRLNLWSQTGTNSAFQTTDKHHHYHHHQLLSSARLWQLLQKSLFDVKAARRLIPLTQASSFKNTSRPDSETADDAVIEIEEHVDDSDVAEDLWLHDDFYVQFDATQAGHSDCNAMKHDTKMTISRDGLLNKDTDMTFESIGGMPEILPPNSSFTAESQHRTALDFPELLAPSQTSMVPRARSTRSGTSAAQPDAELSDRSGSGSLFDCTLCHDINIKRDLFRPTSLEALQPALDTYIDPRTSLRHTVAMPPDEVTTSSTTLSAMMLQSSSDLPTPQTHRAVTFTEELDDEDRHISDCVQITYRITETRSTPEHPSLFCNEDECILSLEEAMLLEEAYDEGYFSRNVSQNATSIEYDEVEQYDSTYVQTTNELDMFIDDIDDSDMLEI